MKSLLFFIGLWFILSSYSEKPAYTIFLKSGKRSDFATLAEATSKADVVLFGEIHNVSIAHWLELQLEKELFHVKSKELIVGAEMLEADDQLVVNEYLRKLFEYSSLKNEAKLWKNFETDYKPLLDFARDNELKFIASNAPRRYSGIVYNFGMDSVDHINAEAKNWLAPLPVQIDTSLMSYKEMKQASGHGGDNLLAAQALKDATMGWFISKNFKKGNTFLHFNGAYHNEGICYYLKKYHPNLKIITISCVEQEQIELLDKENLGMADFIIAIPADMAKSY